MKKTLVLISAILLTFNIFSQKIYSEKLINCPLKFILEDNEKHVFYEPNDSILWVDFLNSFEEKDREKFIGVVMIQVMMDTAMNPCLVSYTNKTNVSERKMDIINRVQNLPGWKREAEGLENTNICALISMYFNTYEVTVQRTGYNRNRGKHTISSTVFVRKERPKGDKKKN